MDSKAVNLLPHPKLQQIRSFLNTLSQIPKSAIINNTDLSLNSNPAGNEKADDKINNSNNLNNINSMNNNINPISNAIDYLHIQLDQHFASHPLNRNLNLANGIINNPSQNKIMQRQLKSKEEFENMMEQLIDTDSLDKSKRKGYWMSSGNGRENVTCFDNGCLEIPDKGYSEWLNWVAEHYETGPGSTKYNELYNPCAFRFFIDWDLKLKANKDLGLDFIQPRMTVVQQVMSKFFPQGGHKVIVSYARQLNKIKPNEEYDKGYYRHGLHLNFPEVVCTVIHAKLMAQTICDKLEFRLAAHSTDSLTLNPITDQIDLKPYKSNKGGLRMIYQSKMEVCGHCEGGNKNRHIAKKNDIDLTKSTTTLTHDELQKNEKLHRVCMECLSTGKVEVGRMYRPIYVFNEDGTQNLEILKKCQTNVLYALQNTSIRVPETCPIRMDFTEPSLETDSIRPIEVCPNDLRICQIQKSAEVKSNSVEYESQMFQGDLWRMAKMFDPVWKLARLGTVYENWGQNRPNIYLHYLKVMKDKHKLEIKEEEREKSRLKLLGKELSKSALFKDKDRRDLENVLNSAEKKSTDNLKKIYLSEEDELELETFLQEKHDNWSRLKLARSFMYTNQGNKSCIVCPVPYNHAARYCMNKGDFHNSSKVWFLIKMRGKIFQRCSCQKDILRPNGTKCRDCRIPLGVLPMELCAKLGLHTNDYVHNTHMVDESKTETDFNHSDHSNNSNNLLPKEDECLLQNEIPKDFSEQEKISLCTEFTKNMRTRRTHCKSWFSNEVKMHRLECRHHIIGQILANRQNRQLNQVSDNEEEGDNEEDEDNKKSDLSDISNTDNESDNETDQIKNNKSPVKLMNIHRGRKIKKQKRTKMVSIEISDDDEESNEDIF